MHTGNAVVCIGYEKCITFKIMRTIHVTRRVPDCFELDEVVGGKRPLRVRQPHQGNPSLNLQNNTAATHNYLPSNLQPSVNLASSTLSKSISRMPHPMCMIDMHSRHAPSLQLLLDNLSDCDTPMRPPGARYHE